jgi:NAD(P)H-hydrate repair Nnr-like enzyme with NAD(P)H-hydrate dehydratase domain
MPARSTFVPSFIFNFILRGLISCQVFELIREKQQPVLIDADGLYIVTKNLHLVKGYPNAILTPNRNEYQRLAAALDVDTHQVSPATPDLLK